MTAGDLSPSDPSSAPNQVAILSPAPSLAPAPFYAPTPKAAKRTLEFFTTQIANDHTRLAYLNATRRFAQWCGAFGMQQLTEVQPIHVAAFVKDLRGEFSRKRC